MTPQIGQFVTLLSIARAIACARTRFHVAVPVREVATTNHPLASLLRAACARSLRSSHCARSSRRPRITARPLRIAAGGHVSHGASRPEGERRQGAATMSGWVGSNSARAASSAAMRLM